MKTKRLSIVACLFLLLNTTNLALAQVEQQAPSLSENFTEIIENAESYEAYKVIKTSKLISFKNNMLDSLQAYRERIKGLESDVSTLKTELDELKAQFAATQVELEESEAINASMSVLGIPVNKASYNIVVWSLVGVLAICIAILYFRIKHVCAVVKRVKSAYSKIMDEYRTQRHQSVEKQMKLKREMQTMQNRLEMLQSLEETAKAS